MNRYVYCDDPEYQFRIKVESFEIDDVVESFEIEGVFGLNEFIDLCVDSCELSGKCQGFFPDLWGIQRELCSHVKTCMENRFGGRIFGETVDEHGVLLSSEPLDLLSEIVEMRYDAEEGQIDTALVILAMLRNFLDEGVWQYGLRHPDGTILTDVSQWPSYVEYQICGSWDSPSGILQPTMWFGLKHERPIECWMLDSSSKRSELLEVHGREDFIERWHSFWFNASYIDWDSLFDGEDFAYNLLKFVECGMDSPVNAFDALRESCPIELHKYDTATSIARRLDEFFIHKRRIWETGYTF